MVNSLYYDYLATETYHYILVSSDKGLCYLGLTNEDTPFWNRWKDKYFSNFTLQAAPEKLTIYKSVLKAYLNGERTTCSFSLHYNGTNFQKEVWKALQTVSYGQTTTYSEIAKQIGRPKAVRAVANAIANNPLLIVVPCHRIIGKNGSLTGFRAGLSMKKKLLALESNE